MRGASLENENDALKILTHAALCAPCARGSNSASVLLKQMAIIAPKESHRVFLGIYNQAKAVMR